MNHISEQKSIAKNTIFLYIRMIVVMFVSLFTSRVVLDKLGVEDYGIYNIVGGIVVSFAFVKNSLMSASQRFISFSKGKNDNYCSSVFSMSLNIHFFILIIVILILETLGLWFFNHIIQIPNDRQVAAAIVFQISVFTFCFSLIQVPYSSLIISNERMNIFAVFSVVDALLKLVVAYLMAISRSVDKLVLYSLLLLIVTIIQTVLNFIYCNAKLKEDCIYRWGWDKKLFKEMGAFSSWNLAGGVAGIATTEGPNFLMNYYIGVNINAAMGIAKQVSNTVYGFSANFQTAFNPQIVKAYASNDYKYLFDLIFRASKLSFFLVYIIVLPLVICCDDILSLWLTVVPDHTSGFCILILMAQVISAISSPFWMVAHAIGNIKYYQLILISLSLSMIPVAWIVLALDWKPEYILVYQVLINIIVLVYRVNYLKRKVNFPYKRFYKEVIFKCCVLICLLSFPLTFVVSLYMSGIIRIILTMILSLIMSISLFYLIGLNQYERIFFRNLLVNKLKIK